MIDISLKNDLIVSDPLDIFLQQMDIVFNTRLTSLQGVYSFGTDFERFIWTMGDQSQKIREYVKKIIVEQCSAAS